MQNMNKHKGQKHGASARFVFIGFSKMRQSLLFVI